MQIKTTENNISVNGNAFESSFFFSVASALQKKGIELKLNNRNEINKRHYPLIAKACRAIKDNDLNPIDFQIIINRNLRYGKAKGRKAIKIGQTNDMISGFPQKIYWLLIDNKLYEEGNNNGFDIQARNNVE